MSVNNDFIGAEEDAQKDKFLTFTISNESYGIDIRYVTEIIGLQPITEVPELPDFIKGVINLRGKIIPVMDVRLRFKEFSKEYDDRTCVIVIHVNDIPVGLIVDSVSEVLSIPEEDIVSPPEITSRVNNYINGIGKVGDDIKLLLNCDKLINDNTLEQLGNI